MIHIDPTAITLDKPEAGWSGICFGEEAFIALSYIQDIPDELIDAVNTWRKGEDVSWSIDGEGSIWQVLVPAGDRTVTLIDPYEEELPTDVPSRTFLLRLIDEMLGECRGWSAWRMEYDDELGDVSRDDESTWLANVEKATEQLRHDLTETRSALAAA